MLSLYIQDAVQKGESRGCTRLKNMAVRYLEQTIVRSISLLVKNNLKSPPLALLQPRTKERRMVRDRPDLHEGIPWKEELRQEKSLSGEENQPT